VRRNAFRLGHCLYNMPITYEWDEAKNAGNIAKHGIDFDGAVRIFKGPFLENIDRRRDYG
jgi:uncharacterized DUF497 family protein